MTCPDCTATRLTDAAGHRAFHDLVQQQTGQRRADLASLRVARGLAGGPPSRTVSDARAEASGRRVPAERRALAHGDTDRAASIAARQAGERAARNAADVAAWNGQARLAVLALAATGEPFTSEEVTARCGLPRGTVGTNRNNAVGALLSGAARRGLIRKTGRTVPSTRVSSHGAALAEWVGAERQPERTHR